jgi:signal transduction histidine kinase
VIRTIGKGDRERLIALGEEATHALTSQAIARPTTCSRAARRSHDAPGFLAHHQGVRGSVDLVTNPASHRRYVRERTDVALGSIHANGMLHEFLTAQRADLIERCRVKVAKRSAPKPIATDRINGIPAFLDQLIETLHAGPERSKKLSGAADSSTKSALSEMGISATRHGRELSRQGYTVEQVIRDYGDLCQAITDAALEHSAPIEVAEFRTLNRCLDNAIADSVTEWAYHSNLANADQKVERVDFFVYELRKLIHTATLAVIAIKAGNVGIAGATGAVLDRSLIELRNLLDRSLADLRGRSEAPTQHKLISLADFVAESNICASLEAQSRECTLAVSDVDPKLAVDADQAMLFSAVGNLLDNAFKFTGHKTEVSLNAFAAGDRILIEVADHCGGLPAGGAEKMLLPSTRKGADEAARGLSICRRSVQENNGVLSVRDVPGSGCIFTIDLPRHTLPASV